LSKHFAQFCPNILPNFVQTFCPILPKHRPKWSLTK
jgi:hypothetical protein